MQKPELFHAMEKVLVLWSGKSRPSYQPVNDLAQPIEALGPHLAGTEFWKKWFEERFRQKFKPVFDKVEPEKSDEELHQFLRTDSFKGGDAVRGASVYASLRCNTCHGERIAATNRFFGPDLNGVTTRLSRTELADSSSILPARLTNVSNRFLSRSKIRSC